MQSDRKFVAIIIVPILILAIAYFFSSQRKAIQMAEKLKVYQGTENFMDYLGVIGDDYRQKINDKIVEARSSIHTTFTVLILPDLYGYDDKELVSFFFNQYQKHSQGMFQILFLLFPKQGIYSIELDRRFVYAIDEKEVDHANDMLVNTFRKSELEYAEKLKNKDNISNLESTSIGTGLLEAITQLQREISKSYPELESRLGQIEGARNWKKFRFWVLYTVFFLLIFGLINYWFKSHCPRCGSKMMITQMKNNDWLDFKLVKCYNCGYLRRRKEKKIGRVGNRNL